MYEKDIILETTEENEMDVTDALMSLASAASSIQSELTGKIKPLKIRRVKPSEIEAQSKEDSDKTEADDYGYVSDEEIERLVMERTAELHDRNKTLQHISEDFIELLGNLSEVRNGDRSDHVRRVRGFTYILALKLQKKYPELELDQEQIELITSASALHDVGKLLVPDAILFKPGKLTDEEFKSVKQHCENGLKLISKTSELWTEKYRDAVIEIIKNHHERYDGNGYPNGLVGDEIPLSAQIVAVADCFDSLTSKTSFREAYGFSEAVDMILKGQCGQFSEKIFSAFEACTADLKTHALNENIEIDTASHTTAQTNESLGGTKVLLVEGDDVNLEISKEILETAGAEVTSIKSGKEAIGICLSAKSGDFDMIIIDRDLEGFSGAETTKIIRALKVDELTDLPIFSLAGSPDEKADQECIDAGMDACLIRPIKISNLTKALITEMKTQSVELKAQLNEVELTASYDALTGLKNSAAYHIMLNELSKEMQDSFKPGFAIVMCDINDLKKVNDNLGHEQGDMYILNGARLLKAVFSGSPIYRIGGDEFVVILSGENYEKRRILMETLKEAVNYYMKVDTIEKGRISIASGIGVYNPITDTDIREITMRADEAMYANKKLMKEAQGISTENTYSFGAEKIEEEIESQSEDAIGEDVIDTKTAEEIQGAPGEQFYTEEDAERIADSYDREIEQEITEEASEALLVDQPEAIDEKAEMSEEISAEEFAPESLIEPETEKEKEQEISTESILKVDLEFDDNFEDD